MCGVMLGEDGSSQVLMRCYSPTMHELGAVQDISHVFKRNWLAVCYDFLSHPAHERLGDLTTVPWSVPEVERVYGAMPWAEPGA